jgi:hypothetical protein
MVEALSGTPFAQYGMSPQRIIVASRSADSLTTTGTCSLGSTR